MKSNNKKKFSAMKKLIPIIVFLALTPVFSTGQSSTGTRNVSFTEIKMVQCSGTATQEIKSESKTENVLDMLQKESEETVFYPLVTLAKKVEERFSNKNHKKHKSMVSSCCAGKEGEAGSGTSR